MEAQEGDAQQLRTREPSVGLLLGGALQAIPAREPGVERALAKKRKAAECQDRLQCVNGRWYNSLGQLNLQGLSCESCVQVGANGYAAYDSRNEQELYHFNRMALSVYTELGMMKELSQQPRHKHCLEPADQVGW